MRPRTQKQPQVKKELCRALDDVDVDVDDVEGGVPQHMRNAKIITLHKKNGNGSE